MLGPLLLLAAALFVASRFRKVSLSKRYSGKYAVVLGGTGSLGTAFCKRLLAEGYSLIVSGRSHQSVDKLKERLGVADDTILSFPYDAGFVPSGSFGTQFNTMLREHSIESPDISIVVMAAGFGEYTEFKDTTPEHKLSLLSCGLTFPVEASDYFYKTFCKRNSNKQGRSALIYISSCLAICPGPNFALYHAAKAGLTALASALYIEAVRYKIDVIAVHPSTIRDSEFFNRPEMHFNKLPRFRRLGHTRILSITPAHVTEETFKYLGLCTHLHVGLTSCATVVLYSLLPRSLLCWLMQKK